MNSFKWKAALAAALGISLAAGEIALAQGKRERGNRNSERGSRKTNRGNQGNRPNRPNNRGNDPRNNRGNNQAERGNNRGERGNNRGNRNDNRGRTRGGIGIGVGPGGIGVRVGGQAGRGNRGRRGGIDNIIGRRWDRGDRGNRGNRRDFYRQRSNLLGNRLRIGIGSDGVRVGVGNNRRYNDWRGWNNDYYARHRWYRGSWNGDWYGRYDNRWRRSWRRYPAAIALGTTAWGLNRMGYWFGYNDYSNPYYRQPVRVGSTVIDYSQPLVAAPPEYDDADSTLSEFEQARIAFKERKYADALSNVNQAIQKQPRDATLHEFRALVLFVHADYREAAETLNPVLAVGPGWDWNTLRGLYSSVDEYTRHLRALERYVDDNTDKADARFLLSYHYLTMGHVDAARKQLRKTVALAPNDAVSKQLLQMLEEDPKIEEPAGLPADNGAKIDPAALIGTWNAKRQNASFSLQLQDDKSFVWTHRDGDRTNRITGVYALQGNTLALEPASGGVMMANVAMTQNNRLKFRMIGSGANDPGLMFSK